MVDFNDDDDAATNFVERRWFAAAKAVEALEGECQTLREVLLMSEEAFRRARMQLAELTELRDSLGECLGNPRHALEPRPESSKIRLSLSAA